jgi:NAD-dependent DNA ligase
MRADHNGDNNDNLTPRLRTFKAMRAAINGVPIVSSDWIKACGQQNEVVVPTSSMFIRSLPTKTDELEKNGSALFGVASLAADYHRATNAKKMLPLADCFVHLCGPFSPKKRSDIQLLAKEAGAKLLSSTSDAISKLKTLIAGSNDSKVVLLCDDSSSNAVPVAMEQEAKTVLQGNDSKGSLLVVNSSWLFDTITCGSTVSPNAFEPFSPRAKELWQLTLTV